MNITLLALVGGILSRWHGSSCPVPKAYRNIAWAIPLTVLVMLEYIDRQSGWFIVAGLVCFGLCIAGKATGHGGGMDMGRWTKPRDPEFLEFLIAPLHGRIPEHIYDGILLSLTGLASVSGYVLTMSLINPLAAIYGAVGGLAKSLAYQIGWAVFPANKGGSATIVGEFLSGAFAFAGIAVGLTVGL